MQEARVWRWVALVALAALAFALGRGSASAATGTVKSQLLNVTHVGTNEEGDVLWAYDYDGANRQWVVYRVDYAEESVSVRVIQQPRVGGGY